MPSMNPDGFEVKKYLQYLYYLKKFGASTPPNMKKISDVEETPFTSSFCQDTFCRKGDGCGRVTPPPPHNYFLAVYIPL
jgi:hypothetical protein